MRTSRRPVMVSVAAAGTGLALVAGLAPASAAPADPVRTPVSTARTAVNPVLSWQLISSGGILSFFEPGLLRTSTGLTVAWRRDDTVSTSSIRTRVISPAGAIAPTKTVVSGWGSVIADPKLVSLPGGQRAVFGGVRSINPGELYPGQMATAAWNGTAWVFDSTNSYSQSRSAYGSYGTTAVNRAGTLVSGFALNRDLTFHQGGDTGHPASAADWIITEPLGFAAYHLSSTVDPATGTLWGAWWTLDGTGTGSLHYSTVLPAKGAIGKLPERINPDQAVALANGSGGPWVAYLVGYPTVTSVRLFNLVTKRTITVPGSANAAHPALSVAPGGRLWVAWTVQGTGTVRVTRTNTTVTRFQPVQSLTRPLTVYTLAVQGSSGPLDVVVNTPTTVSQTVYGLYYRRILPRLTATATYASGRATVRVNDAGLAVAGVTVKYGTRSVVTSSTGVAVINVGTAKGTRTLSITKQGYKSFTLTLKV